MNTSAIHQAIQLNKYPDEMEWLTSSNAVYPDGITDLLYLCSSKKRMESFADKYHIETSLLKNILINYIETVILKNSSSAEGLLGLDKSADLELIKKHYKLLIKIYHPDINSTTSASEKTQKITRAYNELRKTKIDENDKFKNITLSRVPPKPYYTASNTTQIENTGLKNAFIVMTVLALISLTIIVTQLFEPSKPQLIVKSTPSAEVEAPAITQNTFSRTKLDRSVTSNTSDLALQDILRDLEGYYENGEVEQIKPILANSPETRNQSDEQIQAKLETLFKITQERKMLLYDFDWINFSDIVKGSGKFLSRYQMIGEENWKTRKGNAEITATVINGQLTITSFKLENNNVN